MDYYQKYLKYKSKYLELQNIINNDGGRKKTQAEIHSYTQIYPGDCPLHYAIMTNEIEKTNQYIVSAKNKGESNHILFGTPCFGTDIGLPLDVAVEHGNINIINLLLKEGADINASGGRTPLHVAVEHGNIDIINLLLEKGANINAKNEFGYTLFHVAVFNKNISLDIINLLLTKGLDINAKNNFGNTPLHVAVKHGNKVIINLLLEKGADINAKNKGENTPLHVAVEHGNIDIINLLLEKRADINAKNKDGFTPLHIASKNQDINLIKMLLQKNAKENEIDNSGNTPLYYATYYDDNLDNMYKFTKEMNKETIKNFLKQLIALFKKVDVQLIEDKEIPLFFVLLNYDINEIKKIIKMKENLIELEDCLKRFTENIYRIYNNDPKKMKIGEKISKLIEIRIKELNKKLEKEAKKSSSK